LDKVDWENLSQNNFSNYLIDLQKQENKIKTYLIHTEIKNIVYSVPPNVSSYLPKGGQGYLEIIKKYKN